MAGGKPSTWLPPGQLRAESRLTSRSENVILKIEKMYGFLTSIIEYAETPQYEKHNFQCISKILSRKNKIFRNATHRVSQITCIKWYAATRATTLVAIKLFLELSIDMRLIENAIPITKDE